MHGATIKTALHLFYGLAAVQWHPPHEIYPAQCSWRKRTYSTNRQTGTNFFKVINPFQQHNSPQWARVSSLLRLRYYTHSVWVLWTWDRLVAQTSTWQYTTLTTDTHPCPSGIRTRNLSKRGASDPRLRPRGQWDRQGPITPHTALPRFSFRTFQSGPSVLTIFS